MEPADTQDLQPAVLDANNNVIRLPFRVDQFHFDRLSNLLSDPSGTLRAAYGNDLLTVADANAMADKLFPRFLAIFRNLGVTCRYGLTPGDEPLFGDAAPFVDHALIVYAADQSLGADTEAGVVLTLSSADRGDLGLLVTPFGSLQINTRAGAWTLVLDFTADVQGLAYGRHGVTILASASTVEIDAAFSATLPTPSDGPAFIVGATDGSHLEVGGAQLKAGTSLSEAKQSFALSADVSKSAIVIAAGDGDGFLKSVLPANGARAQFDLGLAWTNSGGLKVKGAGGLDVDVPAGLSVGGVVSVDSIHVGIRADDSSVTLECSATVGLNLGPVHVVVNRTGMLALLTFPDQGGNLGPLDATLSFKPPSGMGIAIDAGGVTGGGFLSFDPDKSQYEGAASLKIEGVGVSALGLVQTRPDVSFLLLIATTFPVPIQLGLDFSLAGVGGLAGINRTIDLDALETAVWKGTAQDLLFPSAPISNAVAVLGELNTLFPAAPGRYVFGPTGKIFWGTPPILTAQVGLVLELPSPIRIAILGSVVAQFPPVKPVVFLKVNFAGGIDFGTSRFFFDASLTSSRIESYPISGLFRCAVRGPAQRASRWRWAASIRTSSRPPGSRHSRGSPSTSATARSIFIWRRISPSPPTPSRSVPPPISGPVSAIATLPATLPSTLCSSRTRSRSRWTWMPRRPSPSRETTSPESTSAAPSPAPRRGMLRDRPPSACCSSASESISIAPGLGCAVDAAAR